ncbi:hypothetical protein AXF42_Ash019438 [Apostasia shenzhenica]|uniref:Retrotransposon gag domain-containing protein n=1 Tax=Apostasia shenzhenica TaxID=1088818 RepID=A0A2I0AYE0_9ASPA|nr:hypothetical protein AXF42_Ash019438 [Apostasia shenzhenica]
MDQFFDWQPMSELNRVRFAKMKLVGHAKTYWVNLERQGYRNGQPTVSSWEEMKEFLKAKYLPYSFQDRLMDKLAHLRQGSLSVTNYMSQFDDLLV